MRLCWKSGKKGYATQEKALAKSRRILEAHGYVRAYLCPHCKQWHLTHQRMIALP